MQRLLTPVSESVGVLFAMAGPVPDAPFVYTPGMSMPASDVLRQTRREISDLVREVAELARQPIAPSSFFSALLDRTVRALAAEGAVIWQYSAGQFHPLLRTGRLTDRQISDTGRPAHNAMLAEVLDSGRPVVVPPTPIDDPQDGAKANANAATDRTSCPPANPTARPAAVVPLIDPLAQHSGKPTEGETPQYLLEVFLEPDAGVATQRGYLRFTAQMADLAGDFLRLDELRRGRLLTSAQQRLTAALPRLHRHQRLLPCGEAITDVAAELFAVARVSLVRLPPRSAGKAGRGKRGQLIAISHVQTPDRRGAACRAVVHQAATIALSPADRTESIGGGAHRETSAASVWMAADAAPRPTATATATTGAIQQGTVQGGADPENVRHDDAHGDDAPLIPLAVISFGESDRYRLLFQGHTVGELPAAQRGLLENFAVAAAESLRAAQRWESVPLARWWSRSIADPLLPETWQDRSLLRRGLLVVGVGATVLVAALIPTPMQVTLPANLRPQDVRIHYAPGHSVVQQVNVSHGERVVAGQTLLVLQDLGLEEQTTELLGRRAVVGEKLARINAALITAPSSGPPHRSSLRDDQPTSDEALTQQHRVLEEEQRGIDQQLELLADKRQHLVIRADREGVVDAWQTERLALGRPVQTGEPLLRVQPTKPTWVADARVPQNRRQMVLQQLVAGQATVPLRIGDGDGPAAVAGFSRSLAVQPAAGGGSETVVELLVQPPQTASPLDWTNGMPVEVTVDCGQMPLAKVLFFDLFRSLRLQWARWT